MHDTAAPDGRPGPRARARHIALVGLMGAGKTTVGSRLANALGWPLRDSDADIEAAQGRTVKEIRDDRGVDAMHALEASHLLGALADDAPSVICPAASVIDDAACRAALAAPAVVVVWLHVTPGAAARRFAGGPHRPEFGADPAAFLADQAARRDPQFRELATVVVDTDHAAPEATAATVLALLVDKGLLPA